MNNLDKFADGIVTQDNRLRTTTYSKLVEFLQDPDTLCTSDSLDRLIDGFAGWINSSNFKVRRNGFEPTGSNGMDIRAHNVEILLPN